MKWTNWIRDILGSGTSAISANGVPGKTFHCRRGLRQRDHLSPFLFGLTADRFRTLVNQAKGEGRLKLPISSNGWETSLLYNMLMTLF